MDEVLVVHFHGIPAGELSREADGLQFRYDPAYAARAKSRALSASLPLREAPFDAAAARPFFANLLPDGAARQRAAHALGISAKNDLALLAGLGGECAGAVTLLPGGQVPDSAADYRAVSRSRLQEILAELPLRPLLAGEAGVRLSMAGAQPKLPVFIDADGEYFLPLGNAPSTHLLKPEPREFPGLVDNELFCMQLARRLGLDVPETERLDWDVPVYQVRRYDRSAEDATIRRLHQEDFCQVIGVPPEQKYEIDGGPDLVRCFDVIVRASSQPAHDRLRLLRWVVFNLVIGNADANPKNLALLHAPLARLAPFYDLACTDLYPGLAKRLALRIAGAERWDNLDGARYTRAAKELGIAPRLFNAELEDLFERIPEEARGLAEEHPHAGRHSVLAITAIIERRARQLRERHATVENESSSSVA